MNPKITLLLALAAFAISAGSAQHYEPYGSSYNYGPSNWQKSSKIVQVGDQSAANKHSQHSSNKNSGYNTVSKVDLEETQIAQKESLAAPPPPQVIYKPVPTPVYAPAPKY